MVNNNIPRVSTLAFATSFQMDNSLIKKAYFVSLLSITLMFFVVFPSSAMKIPPYTPGPYGPEPGPFPPPPPQVPTTHIALVNIQAPVIPDPTPFEPEVASEYIFEQETEHNVMYEGNWLFEPAEGDAGEIVRVAKPECYHKVQPFYPELARKAGVEGVVILDILIGTDGRITRADVLNSPGKQFGFDDAALNAVKDWKCDPAMINGRKVETTGVVTVKFRMER